MKFLCIIISILSLASLSASPYSMEDLKVLKKQKSYKEYLDHAHDIRPASRSKEWQKMTIDVSLAFIEQQIKRLNYQSDIFHYIEKLADWPSLRDEEFFQIKRSIFAKDYLFSCFQFKPKSPACLKQLNSYWQSSKKTAEDAYSLGTLLQQEFPMKNHWSFFKEITNSKFSDIYCKRNAIEVAFLNTYIFNKSSDELTKKTIQEIDNDINSSCWKYLSKRLKSRLLIKKTSQVTRESLYQVLDLKNSLNEKEKGLYSVVYVLEGPITGEVFNKSWHTIRLLGEDYLRREHVLKELERFEILPGKVFGLADQEKAKVLTKLLSDNIPEYLDHYAIRCLNYERGRSIPVNNNPTPYCKDLLKHAKRNSLLKETTLKQFP